MPKTPALRSADCSRLALVDRLPHLEEAAQAVAQRPDQERQRRILGPQRVDHAQGPGGLAGQRRVDQAEDVVARRVDARSSRPRRVEVPRRQQQCEALHFLAGGEQVALGAIRDQREHRPPGALALLRQPLRQPVRQAVAFDLLQFQQQEQRCERVEPGGADGCALEPGAGDQQAAVVAERVAALAQRVAQFLGRLAGEPHVHQLALREERQRPRLLDEQRGVEVRCRRR